MVPVLSTRDPFSVVVGMVTAVSLAPDRLEDRVDAIVDILLPEAAATVGLLIRADVTHLDVQVLGRRVNPGAQSGMSQQIRGQLSDPLLSAIVRGDLTPTTAARAFGAEEWERSTTRMGCMIAFGVDQVATLPIHGGTDLVTFMVGRAGADFTDEELAMLKAVQPVVTGLGMLLRLPRHANPADSHEGDPVDLSLTGREVEVLELLALGHKATVIARLAGCSTRTVHRHLGNIYDKLGVSDRLSAVNKAHLLGVITDHGVTAS
jgi:DNA-binding CsgD family transcriptional regulator